MASTVSGIPFDITTSRSTATTNNGTNLTNDDFMRILLTEMSTPNFGSLFGGGENLNTSNNSVFGGSSFSSLLSANNSSLLNQSLTASPFSAVTELPLLSLLIGKEIKALDGTAELTGTVQRVLMQNGTAMVDIGDTFISPSSITEIR